MGRDHRDLVLMAKDFLQFLKPEFLDAISEGTEIEEV
jgi:hypothetical protein